MYYIEHESGQLAGPTFKAWSDAYIEREGEYPAGSIMAANHTKKKTYLLKIECISCGFVARTTQKWLEDIGAPNCACNNEPMEIM